MSSKKQRVLYVEDYPVVQTMYTDALKSVGLDVDAVNDGKLALERLSSNTYDVILLDLLLPQVTGVEFLREFAKKNNPGDNSATVVVLTDFDKPQTIQEVKDLGVKQYWIKVENTPHLVAQRLKHMLEDKK